MHFESREAAGELLAEKLMRYQYENCVVLALNRGAVSVGEAVARELHGILVMMLSEAIELPGVTHETIGTLNQRGDFVYTKAISKGLVSDLEIEYRGSIEQQKMQKNHDMNRLLGQDGIVVDEQLRNQVVIAVHDGMYDASPVESLVSFLKPLPIKKLVVATPMAAINAIDAIHIHADDIEVLQPMGQIENIDRYYDDTSIYSEEEVLVALKNINKDRQ